MKLDFSPTVEEQQDARLLRVQLQRILANATDAPFHSMIQSLLHDIDQFLANPETADQDDSDNRHEAEPADHSPLAAVFSFWDFLTGPSNREIELGKQRAELIERAEHAESSAFEALAELADLKREHAELLQKLKKLENRAGNQ